MRSKHFLLIRMETTKYGRYSHSVVFVWSPSHVLHSYIWFSCHHLRGNLWKFIVQNSFTLCIHTLFSCCFTNDQSNLSCVIRLWLCLSQWRRPSEQTHIGNFCNKTFTAKDLKCFCSSVHWCSRHIRIMWCFLWRLLLWLSDWFVQMFKKIIVISLWPTTSSWTQYQTVQNVFLSRNPGASLPKCIIKKESEQ
jgi:hypothetical protein